MPHATDGTATDATAFAPADRRAYWAMTPAALLLQLGSSEGGLGSEEAGNRLRQLAGAAQGAWSGYRKALLLLLRQFMSPLILILLLGAALSLLLRNWIDALIMLTVLIATGLVGFVQEFRASRAVEALETRLALKARVLRDGQVTAIAAREVVPGDIVELSAGDLIPADGMVLAATDFLVTEAALTGESLPVEKSPGVLPPEAALAERSNAVFAGTSVRSGMARVIVASTGAGTELGGITAAIGQAEPETDFERGVTRFGHLLMRVMFVLVISVIVVNAVMGRPVVESLLFAVALAVGMTPELLPAIVTVTLSAGARQLAERGVLVRRLAAIENLGSMDMLCTDKTGTLTEGNLSLSRAVDPSGGEQPEVLVLAHLNAAFETGIENPMDAAILAAGEKAGLTTDGWRKLDEIPYDFVRKRLTIVAVHGSERQLIAKGAVPSILSCCSRVAAQGGTVPLDDDRRAAITALVAREGQQGYRALAVARRHIEARDDYTLDDEKDLTLEGFLLFADPPKRDIAAVIARLTELGVGMKIITGDTREVAVHVAEAVGLRTAGLVTGRQLAAMSADALAAGAEATDIFCEIDPQQKERIIQALQARGHVVGYMGDGINDAPALHAADVGISVESAVDVARQSADFVLLKQDLGVLGEGIVCGRRAFANTQKYIAITTSANFGNMVSMALATPFLPFLPLLPKQVLLNNFLSDIPAIALSTDRVEQDQLQRSGRWNMKELQHFMIIFGLVSSVFDMAGFVFLLGVLKSGEREFQTGWFVLSLLTEILVVSSLRTRGPALRGHPSLMLIAASLAVSMVALAMPYVPVLQRLFDFVPLEPTTMAALVGLAAAYVAATEMVKLWFYRKRAPAS
ncbi:magnesium-translocating P-type ATPase [Aestuariivirga sp.]|uniref:magnesium-translocating P-type ATPase n=1 Tax=Aestuariivirga sp. TaxID=2650926 RepID=UPI0035B2CC8F